MSILLSRLAQSYHPTTEEAESGGFRVQGLPEILVDMLTLKKTIRKKIIAWLTDELRSLVTWGYGCDFSVPYSAMVSTSVPLSVSIRVCLFGAAFQWLLWIF